jgi:hypothetical protein
MFDGSGKLVGEAIGRSDGNAERAPFPPVRCRSTPHMRKAVDPTAAISHRPS